MLFASNGTKFYIGGVVVDPGADVSLTTFTSQTWTEIKDVESLGTFGDAASEVTFDSLGQNRTKRVKGTRNAGQLELVCGLNASDAGQLALIAAEKTISDYAFRVVFNDAPAGGTASDRMFIAKVASASEAVEAANNVVKLNATLWVNSNIVRTDAHA